MHDDVRPRFLEQPDDVRLVRQVVPGFPDDDDVAAAVTLERRDDVASEKPAASGHEHAFR